MMGVKIKGKVEIFLEVFFKLPVDKLPRSLYCIVPYKNCLAADKGNDIWEFVFIEFMNIPHDEFCYVCGRNCLNIILVFYSASSCVKPLLEFRISCRFS